MLGLKRGIETDADKERDKQSSKINNSVVAVNMMERLLKASTAEVQTPQEKLRDFQKDVWLVALMGH